MNAPPRVTPLMIIAVIAGCGKQSTPPGPMKTVSAEHSFAAAAAEKEMRAADSTWQLALDIHLPLPSEEDTQS